jgi:hypothetical protein
MAEVTSGKDLTVIVLDADEVAALGEVLNLAAVARIIDGYAGADGYPTVSNLRDTLG